MSLFNNKEQQNEKKLDIKIAGSSQTFATTKEAVESVLSQLKEDQKSSLLDIKIHEHGFEYVDRHDGNIQKTADFPSKSYIGRICTESLICRDGIDWAEHGFVGFIKKGCRKPTAFGVNRGIKTTITVLSK